jgi:hypothetical protein
MLRIARKAAPRRRRRRRQRPDDQKTRDRYDNVDFQHACPPFFDDPMCRHDSEFVMSLSKQKRLKKDYTDRAKPRHCVIKPAILPKLPWS